MGKDEKAPPSSGRGGPMGAPALGDQPEELRPERDPETPPEDEGDDLGELYGENE